MDYEMTAKDEFLSELSQALFGKLSPSQVNAEVRYYSEYIMEQAAKGLSEEEIIASLGAPNALARTIADSYAKPVPKADKKPDEEEYLETKGKIKRENRFEKAAKSRGFDIENENKSEDSSDKIQRSYTEDDQYMEGYRGIKATFSEEKGWDVRLGPLKLNKWYGTLIILAAVVIIAVIGKALMGK